MDIQIASALGLSSDMVWFSRQSFAEEMASLPSSGGTCNYSDYIPSVQQHISIEGATFASDTGK
jgi:hypothetical protein